MQRSGSPPLDGPSKKQVLASSPSSILADRELCSCSSTETLDCMLVPWPKGVSTSTTEQQVMTQLMQLAEVIYVQGLDCKLPPDLLRCDALAPEDVTPRQDLLA